MTIVGVPFGSGLKEIKIRIGFAIYKIQSSPFFNFSNTPNVAKVFEQAVGPGDLQAFSTCAVKH